MRPIYIPLNQHPLLSLPRDSRVEDIENCREVIQCLAKSAHEEWSTIGSIHNHIHKHSWFQLSDVVQNLISRAVFSFCFVSWAMQAK
ncbi:hypothetical protein IEQ34_008796 [Dendrobium chrysotoxum]|uniref:Uncharacterized protein n=1 Tax=Dendrobium chrysotoxum TaxID=161865 RepID=A0AAV7GWV0_DENCH|nr:hypothetical protein IEQ34_008796 [Dendrobium chrysotoxum]